MGQMAYSLQGVEPYQISFKQSALYLRSHLSLLPGVSPGKIPRHYLRAVKKEATTLSVAASFESLTDKHYATAWIFIFIPCQPPNRVMSVRMSSRRPIQQGSPKNQNHN